MYKNKDNKKEHISWALFHFKRTTHTQYNTDHILHCLCHYSNFHKSFQTFYTSIVKTATEN